MSELEKRTWAEVNLDNIRHNYRAIRAAIPAGCKFLGVVKANAYGHGALEVARTLAECGADYLAVSCLDEAMELRDGGITMPLLILGHTPCEYTRMLVENDITQTITWRIPVIMVASTFLFSWLFGKDPVNAVLSGGLLFAAVFMATDYVTCPMSVKGQYIFAGCAGLLIALIRKFGLYPEGVTFAILLMNVATPLIDRYTKRRVYGYEKEAKA